MVMLDDENIPEERQPTRENIVSPYMHLINFNHFLTEFPSFPRCNKGQLRPRRESFSLVTL